MPPEANPSGQAALCEAFNQLPATSAWDVIVVGGGPAGCAAAIAASRDGARTLLLEQHGFLGGMGTAALVPAFCPFTDREKPIIRGIGMDILQAMKDGMPHLPNDLLDWVPIDAEGLKFIYEDRVTGSGAAVYFHTHFVESLVDDHGRLTGVVIHNKSGLQRLESAVFIDATGDGDVAARAGARFQKGDPQDGSMQPCTMCFILAGIDNQRLQAYLWADNARNLLLKPAIAEAKAAGELDILEEAANVAYQSPSTIGLNFSHVFDVDGTNAADLSRANREGRRLIRQLTAFMRKYVPGCEQAYLVTSGVQVGVRETRRIVGDYVLTLDDYLARRSFEDDIARNSYYIDIHLSKAEWERCLEKPVDWDEKIHQYAPGESHGIPYRSLLPVGLSNLLVAGRCISTDRPVQGSVRVMPNCLATGEAAGCAAAIASARHAGEVRAVDVKDLQQRLLHHGQYLGLAFEA